ncbi:thiosulfate oxidation carrier protein SoxY [Paenalcaligenes hominis]|uniref:thiosulfate oxidation carrier protein SoxY n=1 Tax=Paenalcaligenes hominis TaxID=643674 RepID=UPI00352390A3
MTSSKFSSPHFTQRRQVLSLAVVGFATLALPTRLHANNVVQQLLQAASPAEVKAQVDAFLQGATPNKTGLKLQLPTLGDNPAAVPVKVIFDLPISRDLYCEELIILAERNPKPLACRFQFTPAGGTTEVAVRLRLIESQTIQALARMSDGQYLVAQQAITVTAGGCGM